ncbi:MAG: hypothetical protein FJ253_07595 [Phycisphaerae bacterium]|nr:hypothetical protein [Phycisphaerae bacterium]
MNTTPPNERTLLGWMRANRNLLLFLVVLLMIVLMPAYQNDRIGEVTFAVMNLMIVATSALTNGAWRALYWTSVIIGAGAIAAAGLAFSLELDWLFVPGWSLAAIVHLLSIVRLISEIFHARSITRDHLFACANAYLLMAVAWCYLYALLQFVDPGALSGFGARKSLHPADAMYFSFNVVTSVALTQVLPTNAWAKMVVLLQELASVLYMAFVISRLVGQYAPSGAAPAK